MYDYSRIIHYLCTKSNQKAYIIHLILKIRQYEKRSSHF